MFFLSSVDKCDMMQNYCVLVWNYISELILEVNFHVHDHTFFDSAIAVCVFMKRFVSPHYGFPFYFFPLAKRESR
jgi:hypothetical protein